MSKQIKQMEMDVLKTHFKDVRDLVVLSMVGVPATAENTLRLALRKKNVHMQMVKNTLARRVFGELGMTVGKSWSGPTVLAWGTDSLADLSKTLDGFVKKNEKIVVKGAIADGLEVTFKQALEMPTRAEALGTILGMILSPASQIVSQIVGPASQIASQIQQLSEKKPEEKADEPVAVTPA